MKIGILTGGGDCPGLNAVIRAVARKAFSNNDEVFGFQYGWKGVLEATGDWLTHDNVSGILHRGGTILGTSRTNPYKTEDGEAKIKSNLEKLGIDALIAVGGEDTLGVATKLAKAGLPVVGVPKTIDNDLSGTDVTFGFDTAINIAMEAIDRIHTTAESHNRVMVVEVMGRHAGWIALYSGLAGGGDVILIPEKPFDLDEVCELLKKRHARGKSFSIVVASEGATVDQSKDDSFVVQAKEVDEFGHVRLGGIGNLLAGEIEERTGFETRATILGHIQRGGSPTAADRVLGSRYGVFAYELAKKGEWGKMAALRGQDIVAVDIENATRELKTVDLDLYKVAEVFFG